MNSLENIINKTACLSENALSDKTDDFIGNDGLLHCGKCRTPKQVNINAMGKDYTVYCMCKCQMIKQKKMRGMLMSQEIDILKSQCFQNREMWNMTFENDKYNNEHMKTARLYVKNFEKYSSEGKGLCLYGDVGTGKTYMAAAIANALIDKGKSVLMSTLGNIRTKAFDAKDKSAFYEYLNKFSMLIIDDLGAESYTSYMKEITFMIIDNRISAKMPIIITTNLTSQDFKNPDDIANKRLYSRIWEVCQPVHFVGDDIRKIHAAENVEKFHDDLVENESFRQRRKSMLEL